MSTRIFLLTGGAIWLVAAAVAQASAIGTATAGGYTFTNFDFPNSGNAAGAGTNANGISNNGAAVGFSTNNNGTLSNFVRNPDGTFSVLNTGQNAMAFGINSAGDVVGTQNNAAFSLPPGGSPQTLLTPNGAATAFGINDLGNIVGQYNAGPFTPGFLVANSAANSFTQINAPLGPNILDAQGINNKGLLVGLYLGVDGQAHGFQANIRNANNGILTGTAIPDPIIPNNVPGEPGATFVFSQILGVNDSGIAVGYYADSTASQHGFFYNTNTALYTFLDDPAEQFSIGGVEVTQITGINNVGEITGFYSDANGVFHGFVGCPVGITCPTGGATAAPEPASWLLGAFGLAALVALHGLRASSITVDPASAAASSAANGSDATVSPK
jgi:hypothetical protein